MRTHSSRLHQAVFFPLLAVCLALPAGTLHAQQQPGPGGQRHGGGFANAPRVQGEVTAISGLTLTLKAEDGTVSQVVTTDNTHIMKSAGAGAPAGASSGEAGGQARGRNMQPAKLADIKVGDGAMAMGQLDPATKTLHAAFVMVTDAAEIKAMRESLGKTAIAGRVTAIDLDNATMTVTRPDGVSQTIGFDESTSFHRGGHGFHQGGPAEPPANDSITLADIKVGDTVAGKGALKNGTFVPGELIVSAPHEHHGDDHGPASAAPTPPPAQ
jgi:hypothetical protein